MTMRNHNSWGRTRRPKALNDDTAVASKETAVAVAVIASGGDLNASINDATAGENGYSTENQRFLHVLVTGNNSKSVEIVGYNYAFGAWGTLQVRVDVDNAAVVFADAIATTGSGGQPKLYIFDIAGIDRVAFVSSDAPASTFAACSTF